MLKMKAAIRRSYGLSNQIKIEKIERPSPKGKELLIRVYATTVNRTDCSFLTGKPFIMRLLLGFVQPKKIILGTDFAGEVIAVGKNVKSFQVGDKVFGFNDEGLNSQAEYISIREGGPLLTMPTHFSYQQAAASLEGAHYAYSFVHRVHIQAGQNILINGTTGAIGSALLQFARQYDIQITATCNTKNIEQVKALGADIIYDYTKVDFTNDQEKYDFIFDAVGKSTYGKCKPLLKKKGVYISSELGSYFQNLFFAISTSWTNNKKVIFPLPHNKKKTFPYILNLLNTGKFKPLIDRSYQLDDIARAYEYVLTGEKTGNVVIDLS